MKDPFIPSVINDEALTDEELESLLKQILEKQSTSIKEVSSHLRTPAGRPVVPLCMDTTHFVP